MPSVALDESRPLIDFRLLASRIPFEDGKVVRAPTKAATIEVEIGDDPVLLGRVAAVHVAMAETKVETVRRQGADSGAHSLAEAPGVAEVVGAIPEERRYRHKWPVDKVFEAEFEPSMVGREIVGTGVN